MRIRLLAAFMMLGPALAAAPPAAPGASLEGRWLLVEQSYGRGGSNLVSAEDRIVLELSRQGSGHSGRILDPVDPARGWSWPAWEAGGRLLPARNLQKASSEEEGFVRARYQVKPSEGDEMELEITEEYRMGPRGDLVGTVKVVFLTPEGTRGSYELSRRFERIR